MTHATDLRRLAEQATPGPWHSNHVTKQNKRAVMVGDGGKYVYLDQHENAAYIAAANPQRILALISALESAEAKAESLLDERDDKAEVLEGSFQTNALLIERVQAAERRVAALEEGLRYFQSCIDCDASQIAWHRPEAATPDVERLLLEFGQWLADNPLQRDVMQEAFVMDEPDEYRTVVDAFLAAQEPSDDS